MIIPHQMLSPEALQGVIEAFVTREGTDYGIQDVSLATKIVQVRQQLDAGTAVLVYDEDTESCTIQPANQLSDVSDHRGSNSQAIDFESIKIYPIFTVKIENSGKSNT